ncbi:MAG: hypothetical protein ACI3X2_00090 [Butyricicoccus porcorum]
MKAFVKTKSTEKVSIMGYERDVDWSRDAVAIALIAASEKEKTAQTSPKETIEKTAESRICAMKQVYCDAINQVLGDLGASKIIFAEDDSLEVVTEVYEYLTAGYTAYRKRRMAAYSPERIADESAD